MKSITTEAVVWRDPLLRNKRIVSILEPLRDSVLDIDDKRSDTGNVYAAQSQRCHGYGTAVTSACAR